MNDIGGIEGSVSAEAGGAGSTNSTGGNEGNGGGNELSGSSPGMSFTTGDALTLGQSAVGLAALATALVLQPTATIAAATGELTAGVAVGGTLAGMAFQPSAADLATAYSHIASDAVNVGAALGASIDMVNVFSTSALGVSSPAAVAENTNLLLQLGFVSNG